jgi:hypothetical protein
VITEKNRSQFVLANNCALYAETGQHLITAPLPGLEIVFLNYIASLRYKTELRRNLIFSSCVRVQSFFMFAVLQD